MNKEEIENRIKELKNYTQEVWTDNELLQHDMRILSLEKMLLQEENKQLKEQVDRLIKKEYEKDNKYIVKVRTGEQLEREQYLLNFKSKSMLASMIIDAEEKIDKAIEYINFIVLFNQNINGKFSETLWGEELLEILKGDNNE